MAPVAKRLSAKCEALSSNPSIKRNTQSRLRVQLSVWQGRMESWWVKWLAKSWTHNSGLTGSQSSWHCLCHSLGRNEVNWGTPAKAKQSRLRQVLLSSLYQVAYNQGRTRGSYIRYWGTVFIRYPKGGGSALGNLLTICSTKQGLSGLQELTIAQNREETLLQGTAHNQGERLTWHTLFP
jgi:hypothetical protein